MRLNALTQRPAYVRRALMLLFALVTLLGPPPPFAAVHAAEGPYHEENGRVVIEAEHATTTLDRAGATWQRRADRPDTAGEGLLYVSPNAGSWFGGSTGPEAQYPITFHQSGTYVVWVRAVADSSGDNSVRFGLNGEPVGVLATTSGGAWAWSSDLTDYGGRATLRVTALGTHVLSLWAAEDGARIDRILLTTNLSEAPSGAGPAESMRGGAAPAPAPPPAPSSGEHPMGCSSREVWLDAQDWWASTPGRVGRDGDAGDDFGHLHTGLCFPITAELRGVVPLRVRSVLHHNPGRFREIEVQLYQSDEANIVAAERHFERRLSTCTQSGGQLSDGGMTCTWWDTIAVDTRKARYDGEVQFRVRAFVSEPDGKDMRTSTSLHATLRNGGRRWFDGLYQDLSDLEGRGWYTGLNYAAARLKNGPRLREAVSGVWRVPVALVRGAEGGTVTGWYAGVDTDFHRGNPGLPLCPAGVKQPNGIPQCGSAPFSGNLTIDTRQLSNGWHRLLLKTDQYDPQTGSTHSGVLATYFLVNN
ncbi:MAG TPA: hypothetical protein PKD53_20350 [Chloroflexaceae bacterium]|nr:hypothetical protein [Chloroflexaceae bacterium]